MSHCLYLAAITLSAGGVILLSRRLDVHRRRLVRAGAFTVPAFLAFDALGAARGWFWSNPGLSLGILPPGIPVEEPVLLAFLVLVAVAMWRGAARLLGED